MSDKTVDDSCETKYHIEYQLGESGSWLPYATRDTLRQADEIYETMPGEYYAKRLRKETETHSKTSEVLTGFTKFRYAMQVKRTSGLWVSVPFDFIVEGKRNAISNYEQAKQQFTGLQIEPGETKVLIRIDKKTGLNTTIDEVARPEHVYRVSALDGVMWQFRYFRTSSALACETDDLALAEKIYDEIKFDKYRSKRIEEQRPLGERKIRGEWKTIKREDADADGICANADTANVVGNQQPEELIQKITTKHGVWCVFSDSPRTRVVFTRNLPPTYNYSVEAKLRSNDLWIRLELRLPDWLEDGRAPEWVTKDKDLAERFFAWLPVGKTPHRLNEHCNGAYIAKRLVQIHVESGDQLTLNEIS